jgi:hypothetical protein
VTIPNRMYHKIHTLLALRRLTLAGTLWTTLCLVRPKHQHKHPCLSIIPQRLPRTRRRNNLVSHRRLHLSRDTMQTSRVPSPTPCTPATAMEEMMRMRI